MAEVLIQFDHIKMRKILAEIASCQYEPNVDPKEVIKFLQILAQSTLKDLHWNKDETFKEFQNR